MPTKKPKVERINNILFSCLNIITEKYLYPLYPTVSRKENQSLVQYKVADKYFFPVLG